jgi:hypothetical protein
LIRYRWAEVVRITGGWDQVQELLVSVEGRTEKALAYVQLTGGAKPGDEVLLNTTAVRLGLGSGGYHFVLQIRGRLPDDPPDSGHLMKLNYAPWQIRVLSVEEKDSPHHGVLREADDLEGMPVVACSLHSHLGPVVGAIAAASGKQAKVAYVMTDGACLSAPFSRLIKSLREAGLIVGAITCGQAFGGDLEAVNVYSGLLAARRVLGADIAVAAMGPGIIGTSTRFGFSGVEQGELINAASALGGRPVACLRASSADPRPRHRGISHHSLTALGRVALAPAVVPLPAVGEDQLRPLIDQIRNAHGMKRHRIEIYDGREGLRLLDNLGIRVTTMGRNQSEDPLFFLTAAAAGAAAAGLMDCLA